MISVTGIILIILIYVIPLNLVIYNGCEVISDQIISEMVIEVVEKHYVFIERNLKAVLVTIHYILIILLLFIIIRFLLYVIQRYLYLAKDIDVYEKLSDILVKYDKGLEHINFWGKFIIIAIFIVLIYFKIYDIRLVVFGILLILFVFRKYKVKKKRKKSIIRRTKKPDNEEILEERDPNEDYKLLKWKYDCNSISVKEPILLEVEFNITNNHRVMAGATEREFEKNVFEFSKKVQNLCKTYELSKEQRIEVVLTLISTFKVEEEKEEKTPAQVITAEAGNFLSLGRCAIEILRAMDLDVVEFLVPYEKGETKITFAVEGADLESEDNYFIKDNKKYYYCELLGQGKFYMGHQKNIVEEPR